MVEIICELGKNFVITEQPEPLDVLLERAKQLVDKAKECGAMVVKFQAHNFEDEIHPEAKLVSPHFNQDRLEWVKRNTYPAEFWFAIKEHCRKQGVEFLCTPMSRGAAEMLNEEVGVDRWKVGSGDILDFPMLDYIRDSNKPIILSSGMSTLDELKMAYEYVKEKVRDITILHCVSQYPCPIQDLNLATIPYLKKQFPEARIGFSSHCLDIRGSLIAVSLGVVLIEQHFTLDRKDWGPDHKVSLLPEEMKELIESIETASLTYPFSKGEEEAMGFPTKVLQEQEMKFRPIFRKGLYTSRDLKKGEMYEPDMILAMRPKLENAEPSENYPQFLGKWVSEDIKKYEPIR